MRVVVAESLITAVKDMARRVVVAESLITAVKDIAR